MAQFAKCFASRRASLLEAPEWSLVPWEGKDKTLKEQFFDMVMPIPGLLERANFLCKSDSDDTRNQLREVLLQAYHTLQTWEENLTSELTHGIKANSGDDPFDAEIFRTFGMDVAHCLSTCWTVCMVLCTTLQDLDLGTPECGTETVLDEQASRSVERDAYVRRITKCLDYFLDPNAGFGGFQIACLPIGTLLSHYATSNSLSELHDLVGRLRNKGRTGVLGPIIEDFLRQLRESKDPSKDNQE
jgi:hypothetical protein